MRPLSWCFVLLVTSSCAEQGQVSIELGNVRNPLVIENIWAKLFVAQWTGSVCESEAQLVYEGGRATAKLPYSGAEIGEAARFNLIVKMSEMALLEVEKEVTIESADQNVALGEADIISEPDVDADHLSNLTEVLSGSDPEDRDSPVAWCGQDRDECAQTDHCCAGMTCCHGAGLFCVNLLTDTHNCGTCGNNCGPDDWECANGTCRLVAACGQQGSSCTMSDGCCSGFTCCPGPSGRCTDTYADEQNCGDCGVVCDAGAECVNGACQVPPR